MYGNVELFDGNIEQHDSIKTVGELRQILDDLPDDMTVGDWWGHPLEITIAKPTGLKPYMEVQ